MQSSWFSFYLRAINEERHVVYTKKDQSPRELKPEEGASHEEIHEPEEREIAILDESRRVGPNFEVKHIYGRCRLNFCKLFVEEHSFDEEPRVPVKVVHTSSLDMNLFEKEVPASAKV